MQRVNLDLYDSRPADHDGCDTPASRDAAAPRPYIGVLFECCGVYVRIYRRPDEPTYHGRCPRCLRIATAHVAPGGTSERVFRAT